MMLGALLLDAEAHDWWITAHPAYPEAGHAVRFEIGGGHGFPQSGELLAARLLSHTSMSGPEGSALPLAFSPEEQVHMATTRLDTPGVYRVDFHVQRPGDEAPIILGRTLVVVDGKDSVSDYAANEGLELVPLTPITEWSADGEVLMEVRLNGAVIPAMIRLQRETGRPVRLRTAPGRPAVFRQWVAAPGLFIAEHSGQTATLAVWPTEE